MFKNVKTSNARDIASQSKEMRRSEKTQRVHLDEQRTQRIPNANFSREAPTKKAHKPANANGHENMQVSEAITGSNPKKQTSEIGGMRKKASLG